MINNILLALALSVNLNVQSNIVVPKQNCLLYSQIIMFIERHRDAGTDKQKLLNDVQEIVKSNAIKEVIVDNIDLIYNMPKHSEYSSIMLEQCYKDGYLLFRKA